MEAINPDDIENVDPKQISIITLKNGNIITIDDTIPSKKIKNKDKINTHNTYQISQKLINLTIINKREKLKESNDNNINSKNKICKNINFCYLNNKTNKDHVLENNTKEIKNNILAENFKYNDINIGNINLVSNKDEKEIEKIKVVDIDFDSKSNNEYKALINEFEYNRKDKIKLESRIHNINNLLNSKVIIKESKHHFDFANHFNSLVKNFKSKINDLKKDSLNKRYYETYKDIKKKHKYNNILTQRPLNFNYYNNKDNFISKSYKFLTNNNTAKTNDIFLRNNLLSLKDKLFKKNSSYNPKAFRALYLGSQIILPSN